MNGKKWCAMMIACGIVLCADVHSQSSQQLSQAIQRYNSGAIDGDAFSTAVLETAYQSEDPKSVANTLKNSQVVITDQQQWRDTIIELAEYLGLLGEYDEAVAMYEYLIRHPSLQGISATEMWGRIAVLQFVNNDVQSALVSAHNALTTATNHNEVVKALLLDARFRGLSSNPKAGLAAIDALIVHNPSSVHMRLMLYAKFEIQQTMGDEVEAEVTRVQLSQRYPNSLEYGIVNTQAHNASIIASPLPVAIDYIYSLYNEHSSDHTHTHRPVVAPSTSATNSANAHNANVQIAAPSQPTNSAVVGTPSAVQSGVVSNSAVTAAGSSVATGATATTPAVDSASQQVVIQLGAFARQSNAEKLQKKSAAIGVPARVVLIDNIYKVQIQVSRAGVAAVQSQLQQADIDAFVVR